MHGPATRPRRIRFSAALCRGLIEAVARRACCSGHGITFSAALCRGLIEAPPPSVPPPPAPSAFSAALCRGLIEARGGTSPGCRSCPGFPRLYAAASLKPARPSLPSPGFRPFSAALCRGLIEAILRRKHVVPERRFSAALCRGLIEAMSPLSRSRFDREGFPRLYAAASLKPDQALCRADWPPVCFPRLYAAASLKLGGPPRGAPGRSGFSAALCRGLIEALPPARLLQGPPKFSAALCRGLIEAAHPIGTDEGES